MIPKGIQVLVVSRNFGSKSQDGRDVGAGFDSFLLEIAEKGLGVTEVYLAGCERSVAFLD